MPHRQPNVGPFRSGGARSPDAYAPQRASLIITNGDILTLPSTPILVVPAPPAGYMHVPKSGFLASKFADGAYEDVAEGGDVAGKLILTFDPTGMLYQGDGEIMSQIDAGSVLAQAKDFTSWFVPGQSGTTGNLEGISIADYEAKPLYLAMLSHESTDPLVGGHPKNKLAAFTYYDTIKLP